VGTRTRNRLGLFSTGFALLAILVVIVVSWQEVSAYYRVAYVVLYAGLLCAACVASRSKQNTNDGDNNPDNNSSNTFVGKPRNESGDSTAKG
jgi:peptidoglycan/LPS O-acetylase OafA/YrhL